jgi:hypothetical protein
MRSILEPFAYAGFGFVVYKLVDYFTGYWYFGILAGVAIIVLLGVCVNWVARKPVKDD